MQALAYDLSYSSKFLGEAARCEDPIERLKYVIAMYVGGHHVNLEVVGLRSPLNPILGETSQMVLDDGSRFYGEQTSHHPPVTNFLFEGPDNLYRFSGHCEFKGWLASMTSLGGARIGKQVISFKDGGLISIKDP